MKRKLEREEVAEKSGVKERLGAVVGEASEGKG